MRPTDHLTQVRAATGALFRTLERLTDDLVRGPSTLPGWTRGHVLTHLARNADAHWKINSSALDEILVPMYPGGREERDRTIEEQAGRSATVLADDVRTSAMKLHAPGHALLAWLLGRQPAVPIQVERSSDESVALALPRNFPFG